MSGRHHSKAVKLAATVLARLAGEQAASDTFGIDRRTIRGWVKHDDVPTDSWAALDELAGVQLLEKVARGQVTNPATLATVRGIASRNRRYAEVIAERKARREEVVEQPLHERRRAAWHRFDYPNGGTERVPVNDEDEQRLAAYTQAASRYIGEQLRTEISRRAYDDPDVDTGDLRDPYIAEYDRLGDLDLLYVGEFAQWRELADKSEQDHGHVKELLSGDQWAKMPDWARVRTDDMTDDEYTAYLGKLRSLCIEAAHAWWPSHLAAEEEWQHKTQARSQPAPEPVEAVQEPVERPTPAPVRLRRVEPPSDGSMLVDVGQPWQWRRDD